jgi:anti-sigma factor RsiW
MSSNDQPEDPQGDGRLRQRMQDAFGSVQAPDHLRARIRSAVDEARGSAPREAASSAPADARSTAGTLPFPRRLIVPLGAAAAVLLMVVGVVLVHSPGVAHASPIEAIEWMHVKDLQPCRRFQPVEDPDELESYLRNKLGFEAIVPEPPEGGRYVGGCVRSLWDKPAASYLVQLNGRSASVVIFSRKPETLEFPDSLQREGATFHTATHDGNNLACVRVGKVTYAAVGNAATEDLLDLLQAVRDKAKQG